MPLSRLYIPFDESSDNSGGLNFAFGLVNALVFVVIVVVMTVLLVLCFKYRCYRVSAWVGLHTGFHGHVHVLGSTGFYMRVLALLGGATGFHVHACDGWGYRLPRPHACAGDYRLLHVCACAGTCWVGLQVSTCICGGWGYRVSACMLARWTGSEWVNACRVFIFSLFMWGSGHVW